MHLIKEQRNENAIISLIQNHLFQSNIIIQLSFYKKMFIIYNFYQYKIYFSMPNNDHILHLR